MFLLVPGWVSDNEGGPSLVPHSEEALWTDDWSGAVDYIPKHKVALCACAKCGTTAIYSNLYSALLHGKKAKDHGLHDWYDYQHVTDKHVRLPSAWRGWSGLRRSTFLSL